MLERVLELAEESMSEKVLEWLWEVALEPMLSAYLKGFEMVVSYIFLEYSLM